MKTKLLAMLLILAILASFMAGCGIGVVGGLLFAMFLTLYFIPAAFYVSHKNK